MPVSDEPIRTRSPPARASSPSRTTSCAAAARRASARSPTRAPPAARLAPAALAALESAGARGHHPVPLQSLPEPRPAARRPAAAARGARRARAGDRGDAAHRRRSGQGTDGQDHARARCPAHPARHRAALRRPGSTASCSIAPMRRRPTQFDIPRARDRHADEEPRGSRAPGARSARTSPPRSARAVSTWALVPVKARNAGKQRLTRRAAPSRSAPRSSARCSSTCWRWLRAAPLAGRADPLPRRRAAARRRATCCATAAPVSTRPWSWRCRSCSRSSATRVADRVRRPAAAGLRGPRGARAARRSLRRCARAGPHRHGHQCAGPGAARRAFRLQFGAGSCARHQLEADAHRPVAQPWCARPGLAFDVDEPADLEALRARADPRYAFL